MKQRRLLLCLALPSLALGAPLDLAAPAPRVHVEAAGVDIALHDTDPAGTRPAVICLHAVGHGGGDYASTVDALGATHRVLAVDWPGHGASGPDAHPASAARYERVLAELIDQLRLDRVVIVGNSIGGAAAIRYAAHHPDRVRGLVLVDTGGLDRGGWVARVYIRSIARRFRRGAAGDPRFIAWYARFYDRLLTTPASQARRDAIVAAGPQMAEVLAQAWESFAAPDADLRALLPTLQVPILVAWARHDRVIRWSRNRRAIARGQRVEVVRFEGGHSAPVEDPEAFNAALEGFLEALPQP